MTRHFKVTAASGATTYVTVSGDQPDPVAPPGGSIVALDEAPQIGALTLSLPMLKIDAQRRIDAQAEAVRGKVLTPGAGQALVYERKRAEAEAYAAGHPGPYPMLEAEVGITAPDLAGVAAEVARLAAEWTTIAAAIETARLRGKAAVDAAASPEAVAAAVAAVIWPL